MLVIVSVNRKKDVSRKGVSSNAFQEKRFKISQVETEILRSQRFLKRLFFETLLLKRFFLKRPFFLLVPR
jgi:hypothetical protein